jgi:hypothetical protein
MPIGRRCFIRLANHGEQDAALYGFAFGDKDLQHDARRRRGNFGVYLIGADFEQWLELLDLLAHLFEPAGDLAFDHAFAQLGHNHVCCHDAVFLLKKRILYEFSTSDKRGAVVAYRF